MKGKAAKVIRNMPYPIKRPKPVLVTGAVPLATGARAQMLDFADGGIMVIGAEGIPPLITNPATLGAAVHPGPAPQPKTYPNPGARQRLRLLRQQQRQAEKKAK